MLALEAVVTLKQEVEQAWKTLPCASPVSYDRANSEAKTSHVHIFNSNSALR